MRLCHQCYILLCVKNELNKLFLKLDFQWFHSNVTFLSRNNQWISCFFVSKHLAKKLFYLLFVFPWYLKIARASFMRYISFNSLHYTSLCCITLNTLDLLSLVEFYFLIYQILICFSVKLHSAVMRSCEVITENIRCVCTEIWMFVQT